MSASGGGEKKREREKKSKPSLEGYAEAIKNAKAGVSALDALVEDGQEDVYDVVDEDEYARIVDRRRKENDFVVDDDGIGYHDDGEEVLGVSDEPDGKKRLKNLAEDNDKKIGSKVRRLSGGSQTNDMMKFVKAGTNSAKMAPQALKEVDESQLLDIDALMGGGGSSKHGRPPLHSVQAASSAPVPAYMKRPVQGLAPSRMAMSGNNMSYTASLLQDVSDYADDFAGGYMGDETAAAHQGGDGMQVDNSASVQAEPEKVSLMKATRKLQQDDEFTDPGEAFKPVLADADYAAASSLGMSDIGSGAATSHEAIDPKLWLQKGPSTTDAEGKEVPGEDFLNFFWIDIHEAQGVIYLFGKVALTEPAPAAAAPAAPATSAPTTTTRFVSCCVAVHGVERNLFVLPKATGMGFHQDGKPQRADMMKVYSDIKARLVGPIIPRNATGQAFKVKQVKRRYAFEHTDVPREETDYLKVVYSAKYPAPTLQQCAPSDVVERIFGAANAGVSLVEAFLMKRKIFGPCWLTVRNPRSIDTKASYCKLEVGIESPKFVSVSAQKNPPTPSPPLVSLAIALKTAVNPITHVHEVIAISGLVHTKIETDTDTEARPQLMKRFTYIRQLGVSCGMQYPSSFPHDLPKHIEAVDRQAGGKVVEAFTNERALLNRFFIRIQQEDPDILASHNLFGFEFDVLLSRAVANKVPVWDRLGRLKKSRVPKSINDKDSSSGRILCCTYKAAKEFLRETSYGLTSLADSQLHTRRIEVDPVDVPRFFATSLDILKIANHTSMDAMLVQRLMLKLQIVPLTKALTNISGNVWSRTMRGQRAERIEYLLLHRFHFHKYILPERKPFEAKAGKGRQGFAPEEEEEDPAERGGMGGKIGGTGRGKRAKAAYAGGLVLEPKKGLYDHFILLLDFNSLYPSIIQEYNLCFTTVNWTKFMMEGQASSSAGLKAIADKAAAKAAKKKSRKSDTAAVAMEDGDDDDDDDDDDGGGGGDAAAPASMADMLPPLPDSALSTGILPTVIKALVDARRAVKSTMKSERNKDKLANLEIRQKAYKLTANSMYGCLGFSFSRFYARPIAALVTSKGREALTRTVDQATRVMQLDVIYGDTDSVMINSNSTDYKAVMELGMQVKTAVNKLYKSLELDIDGVFKSMLLLKKKKYAALVIKEEKGGELICEKELKGLDLVRRDWCPLSKDTGKFVVDQILSGKPREDIVIAIHDYLQELSTKIRAGAVDLKEFVVTKGLNKAPKDYPDCKGQAHLQVALQMMKNNRPVNIGDHIPYVICVQGEEGASAPQRARHPDDVFRSNGELTLDFEWYLSNQLLPPIARLCEPIEGTSAALMSAKLGLDASKYAKGSAAAEDRDEDYGYVPRCKMSDEERFKSCRRLLCKCSSCGVEQEFRGTFTERGNSGLDCSQCGAMYFGRTGPANCYSYLSNRVTLLVRECVKKYYDCWLSCDDQSCRKHTMQQSVMGKRCTEDCHGHMVQDYTDLDLHTQLKYLETLFDFHRAVDLRAALIVAPELLQQPLLAEELKKREADKIISLTPHDYVALMELLYKHMCNSIEWSGYNWVRPSLWSTVFGKVLASHKGVI